MIEHLLYKIAQRDPQGYQSTIAGSNYNYNTGNEGDSQPSSTTDGYDKNDVQPYSSLEGADTLPGSSAPSGSSTLPGSSTKEASESLPSSNSVEDTESLPTSSNPENETGTINFSNDDGEAPSRRYNSTDVVGASTKERMERFQRGEDTSSDRRKLEDRGITVGAPTTAQTNGSNN